jgi:hypothetical protein
MSPLFARVSAVLAAATAGLLLTGSTAFASTLTHDGDNVTWTADPGVGTEAVALMEPNPGDLSIYTADDPVEYDDQGGTSDVVDVNCTDTDAAPMDGQAESVDCLGISTVTADGGGGEDYIDAGGTWFGAELLSILATLDGGPGGDEIHGGFAGDPFGGTGDTINGGQGNDDLFGYDGLDVISGGENDDIIMGGNDDDQLSGDEGDDQGYGEEGDDFVRGGDADDHVEGGNGMDDVDGEDGSDSTNESDDGGADVTRGGAGTDSISYDSCVDSCSDNDDITIDENEIADDGDVEQDAGNDFNEFENINYVIDDEASARIVTGDASDSIEGQSSIDDVTPGAGSDFVRLGPDNDTANTVDGFPDFVDCGQDLNDNDTANADQFDELIDCEVANITEVPSAYADPDGSPPTVRFTSPERDAILPAESPTALTAEASDDAGVDRVVFMDDTRVLCTATDVPYECSYSPTTEDVGRNTLSAWAVDASGQFGADFRSVRVSKFDSGLTARTNKRDLKGRRRVAASGQLELPAGALAETGCEGVVRVTVEDGEDTIRRRRARVQEDCTWRKGIKLPRPGSIEHDRVRVLTKFLGNEILDPERGPVQRTRIRRG